MSFVSEFPQTLPDILARASETCGNRGLIFVDEDEQRFTWEEIEAQAQRVAAGFQARDGEPGDRVTIVCQGLRPLVTSFFGAVLAGLHPSILPTPISRHRLQGYLQHVVSIVRVAEPKFVVVDEEVELVGKPLVKEANLENKALVIRHDELIDSSGRFDLHEAAPDEIAVIQFTSGSTSSPRGVVLPHRCVAANVQAIVERLEVAPHDVGGGWLPMYHDMGLIGNLLGAAARSIDLVLTTPFNFLRRPRRWLDVMERHNVSITAGPNVSYRHLLERGDIPGRDLGKWRVAIIGAEPVDPELLTAFTEAFGPAGFPKTGFMPAYGLAEVGLMATGVRAQEEYEIVEVDRLALEGEGVARPVNEASNCARIVSCGAPVRETSVRIVDDHGELVPDSCIGEISIAGSSVMREYFNDPVATADTFHGEWLMTGDLGYMKDHQLFVTGRKKELIIFGGRNYYPQDIERVVHGLELVRPGSVVAFGTKNGHDEGIVIVAAPRDPQNSESIGVRVRAVVSESLNLPVLDVVLLESGRIPRTTSGKLCRGRCRDLYEGGELA
ncbi:MAG: fatty acyl-AMP ligase [Acidobacteriota bacterium]|nr:fatty acyl-AMP ligase [Acidobacteriota bacterium]